MVKVGDRIRVIHCDDPYENVNGLEGTVVIIDSLGTIHIHFDNGKNLGLIPNVDKFEVIE